MSENHRSRPRAGHGPMGGPPMGGGEKAKDFKGTLKKLLAEIGGYKFAVLAVIIFAIGSTVFNIIGPKVMGNATTELANGLMAKIQGTGGIDFGAIGNILLFVLGMYLLSALLSFVQGFIMTGVTQKLCYRYFPENKPYADEVF